MLQICILITRDMYMQSIYRQLRAKCKFGTYCIKAGAEVLILSDSNSYTSYQFWQALYSYTHKFSTWIKHSFKHQHAIAGSQSRKQTLSHFALLRSTSFTSFPAILFHNLCALLDHTTLIHNNYLLHILSLITYINLHFQMESLQ